MIEQLFPYLFVSLVINISMFLVAYRLKSDKLTDASYAATFITLAWVAFASHGLSGGLIALIILITAWALRIGGFLLYRVIKTGKDARFDDMRDSFWKFGQFWILQAVTVWVILIPALLTFSASTYHMSAITFAGFTVAFVGLLIETVADIQKLQFNANPANKGHWIQTGLWRYSRHPNYFGEILFWAGIYLFTVPSLEGWALLVGLVSPLFITILLLFVSGIPLLEKVADKRWGDDKSYRRYKDSTSVLILWPPKR